MDSPIEIVIADASCLIGLTNIGALEMLRHVYGRIVITKTVAKEYRKALPDWFEVRELSPSAE